MSPEADPPNSSQPKGLEAAQPGVESSGFKLEALQTMNAFELSEFRAKAIPEIRAVLDSTSPTVEIQKQFEPYSDEQLAAIKENLMGSVAAGINQPSEFIRSTANLMGVLREIDRRLPESERRLTADEYGRRRPVIPENDDIDRLTAAIIMAGKIDIVSLDYFRGYLSFVSDDILNQQGVERAAAREAIEDPLDMITLMRVIENGMIYTKSPGYDDSRVGQMAKLMLGSPERYAEYGEHYGGVARYLQNQETQPHIPTFEENPPYLGIELEIDPIVDRYVADPDSLSEEEKREAVTFTERSLDGGNNMVITHMNDGQTYWANEYPNVFTFNGSLRGKWENWPDNPEDRNGGQALGGPGGKETHVIIETDDGHMFLFRRTNPEEKSAAKQEFEMLSTTMNLGTEGGNMLVRKLSSEELKDVVVRPGHELRLSKNAQTGKSARTRGKVTRITSIKKTEEGKVHPDHPFLQRPERLRSTPDRFREAMRVARTMDAASEVGPIALRVA